MTAAAAVLASRVCSWRPLGELAFGWPCRGTVHARTHVRPVPRSAGAQSGTIRHSRTAMQVERPTTTACRPSVSISHTHTHTCMHDDRRMSQPTISRLIAFVMRAGTRWRHVTNIHRRLRLWKSLLSNKRDVGRS